MSENVLRKEQNGGTEISKFPNQQFKGTLFSIFVQIVCAKLCKLFYIKLSQNTRIPLYRVSLADRSSLIAL